MPLNLEYDHRAVAPCTIAPSCDLNCFAKPPATADGSGFTISRIPRDWRLPFRRCFVLPVVKAQSKHGRRIRMVQHSRYLPAAKRQFVA